MSSFQCEHCGKDILDGASGYYTGCPHYPLAENMVRDSRWRDKRNHRENHRKQKAYRRPKIGDLLE